MMNPSNHSRIVVLVVLTCLLASLDVHALQPLSDWKGKGKSGNRLCQPHSAGGAGAICPGYFSECTRVTGPIFCSDSRAFNSPDYGLYHVDFANKVAVRLASITPRVEYCGGMVSAPSGSLWGFGYDRLGFISNVWQFDSVTDGLVTRSYQLQTNDQKLVDIVFEPFNDTMFAMVDSTSRLSTPPRREWHIARVELPEQRSYQQTARLWVMGSTGLSVTGDKGTLTTASLVILKTGEALVIWVDPSIHWRETKILLVRTGPTDRDRPQTWDITARVLHVCGITTESSALASALRVDMHYDAEMDRVWLWLQCRSNGMNQVTLAFLSWSQNAPEIGTTTNGFYSKSPARGVSAFYDRHYCIESN